VGRAPGLASAAGARPPTGPGRPAGRAAGGWPRYPLRSSGGSPWSPPSS
jgi:hypothetical protein